MSELCGFPIEMVNEARAIQSTVQRLFPLLLQTTTVQPCVPLISRLVQELLELKSTVTNDTGDVEMMQKLYNIRSKVSEGDVEAIRSYLAHWNVSESGSGVDERVEELLPTDRDEMGHNYEPSAWDHVSVGTPPPTDHTSTAGVGEDEMHTDSLFGPTIPTLSTTLGHKHSPTLTDALMVTAVIDAVSVGSERSEPPAQPSLLDLLRLPGPTMSDVQSSQVTPPVSNSNKGAMHTASTLIGNSAKPVPVRTSNPLSTHEAPSPSPAVTHAPKVTTGRLASFMADLRGQLDISNDLTSEDQW